MKHTTVSYSELLEFEQVIERYKAALEEIAKAEGAFSIDPLKHASNTIESMAQIARTALEVER